MCCLLSSSAALSARGEEGGPRVIAQNKHAKGLIIAFHVVAIYESHRDFSHGQYPEYTENLIGPLYLCVCGGICLLPTVTNQLSLLFWIGQGVQPNPHTYIIPHTRSISVSGCSTLLILALEVRQWCCLTEARNEGEAWGGSSAGASVLLVLRARRAV